MDQLAPPILSREAYYRWAEEHSAGRYERVFGEVVRMSPERWRHNRLKTAIFRAFEDAATAPDLQVAGDGMAIAVDDHDFQPDVAVHQGAPIPLDAVALPNPIVIVEVLSPSTARVDTTFKREAYFRLPRLQHYLLFRADRRAVIHFRSGSELPMHPAIGKLVLEPPGLTIEVADIYDRAGIG